MMEKCMLVLIFPIAVLSLKNDTFITIFKRSVSVDNEVVNLSKCIVQVARTDLFYKPTVLIQSGSKHMVSNQELNLLNIIVHELNSESVPLVLADDAHELLGEKSYDGSVLYIFISDCKDFENLPFKDVNAKYFFILTGDVSVCNIIIREIGTTLSENEMTIAYRDEYNKFVFLNARTEMNQSACTVSGHLTLKKPNIDCNSKYSKRGRSILQPKYLRNFRQCPFNFGLATLHPYMTIKNKQNSYKNLDPIVESDIGGSDVELLKIIAHYFNATLKFYFIYRQEENPFADKEFISLVQNGYLDVCAGGLYRVYGDTVAYSGIYTRQAVVWVYSVAREMRSWQSFVMKVNGLYMFLIFYVFYSVFWRIVREVDGQSVSTADTLLYGWGALLGTTSLQDAKSLKQNIANAVYLIMSLHLSAYLSVQLYSYLTVQGPPHLYKTIDELITSGIKPYLRYQSKYFVEDKKYEAFANTSGSCDHFIHCEEVILQKKGTTVLIDGFLPPYQASTAVHDEARVVQVSEVILFVYHEMIIRKNSFFGEPFRKTLLRLFEAGICQKLYNDAVGIIYVDKARIANKNIMSNSYTCQAGCKITLTQSAGAFYIWILGCVLSCTVLSFEVLFHRKGRTS